jgi:membrane fusion protein, copper/silver efflux system
MPDRVPPARPEATFNGPPTSDEGGLRAPPGLSFWRKTWWWFDFLILVKLARLRFIAILLVIGLVIVKWDTLTAYYARWTRPALQDQAAGAEFEYFCPMHPNVIRDNRKEKCPICFMPLSKRKKGEGQPEALPPGIVNRLQLSPYRIVLAGIETQAVNYVELHKEIVTVGFVEFNEGQMKQVSARVKGRIDTLFVSETGQYVHAGDDLASLYSPDLVTTMRDLLNAKKTNSSDLIRIANERLKQWGISEKQIAEFEKTGNTNLKIQSPIEGHVTRKYVKEGQYVEEGSPLYDIVDLTTVWIQAQVYEKDMPFLPTYHAPLTREEAAKTGMSVAATTEAMPGEIFEGKLTFVFPHADQETRSVMARFELDNPDHKLRPGYTATVKLKVPPRKLQVLSQGWTQGWIKETAAMSALQWVISPMWHGPEWGLVPSTHAAQKHLAHERGLVLAVPLTAIIDTGDVKLVYREAEPGVYEGVKVELGPRMVGPNQATYYPVISGLQIGDKVVTHGSFLIDAETRLNPAMGSLYFGGSAASKSGQTSSAVRPTTPDGKDLPAAKEK